jgi:hypothetical protein
MRLKQVVGIHLIQILQSIDESLLVELDSQCNWSNLAIGYLAD